MNYGVAAVQALIGYHSNGAILRLDGIVGNVTRSMLAALPANTKSEVMALAAKLSVSFTSASRTIGGVWMTKDELRPLWTRAAEITGTPAEYLEFLLDLEPSRRKIDGVLHYRCDDKGTFNGVAQVGADAFTDAVNQARESGSDSMVGLRFPISLLNPYYGFLAAGWFARKNEHYAKVNGYRGRLTNEIRYAMHNQGGPGFTIHVVRGGSLPHYSKQSKEARHIIDVAKIQMA